MKATLFTFFLFLSLSSWSQVPAEIVEFPDVEAQFPGGSEGMQRFIVENINYPSEAIAKDISGKVYLSFVVMPDGSIAHVRVERGAHPLLDAEAVRVVENMPKWQPGEAGGKAVPTRCRLPIVFTLTKGKTKKRRRNR